MLLVYHICRHYEYLCALIHLILTRTLWGRYYHFSLTGEKTEGVMHLAQCMLSLQGEAAKFKPTLPCSSIYMKSQGYNKPVGYLR